MHVVFGDCELDAGRRQLFRHGRATPLSAKAFELLHLLLDRRPEAVSKADLLERLWPGTFVSDASLHNLVAEVRAALGDEPRAARYIRTIPRYGYAFHGDAQPFSAIATGASTLARTGPRLVSSQGDWPLAEGPNVVGRDPECTVRIDSATVSRRHARIVLSDGAARVEDLASKNGTFVNGAAVAAPVSLDDGDEVRVGSVTMTYRNPAGFDSTLTQRQF